MPFFWNAAGKGTGDNCKEWNIKMGKVLNDKQRRFVQEYFVDQNATQAAIRAGYSPKTAYSQGPRLLENDEVQRRIEQYMTALQEKTGMTVAGIVSDLREQARIATDLSHTAAAVRAIELIGKTIGAFTDRTETVESHEDRLKDRLKAAEEEKIH